jgi:hypothetical protein
MVARYRLAERTFIRADNTQEAWLHNAGEEIDFSGSPSRNMIALNAEATAALALLTPPTDMALNILPRRGDSAP